MADDAVASHIDDASGTEQLMKVASNVHSHIVLAFQFGVSPDIRVDEVVHIEKHFLKPRFSVSRVDCFNLVFDNSPEANHLSNVNFAFSPSRVGVFAPQRFKQSFLFTSDILPPF